MTEVKIKTLEELFSAFSEKLSTPIEELKQEFESIVQEVKQDETFKGASEDQIINTARNRFSMRKQKEMQSNAIEWEGMILGIGRLVDTVATQKALTDVAFKIDPVKTLKGWVHGGRAVLAIQDTKSNPVPAYPKTENNDKFKRTGKPLPEHSWLRTLFGVGQPIDPKTKKAAGPIQPFTMMINNNPAIDVSKIPVMTTVKFKGINKTDSEDQKAGEYSINYSTFTKFVPKTLPDMPPIENVLRSITSHFVSLGELEVDHVKNEKNYNRWIITEGGVSMLNLDPNPKTGNMMMILSDESMMFEEKSGITCWLPTDRNIVIDFAVESRVYVIGTTSRGKARDAVTGAKLDDVPGDVMINACGIFAPEMFKVKLDIKPITKLDAIAEAEQKW